MVAPRGRSGRGTGRGRGGRGRGRGRGRAESARIQAPVTAAVDGGHGSALHAQAAPPPEPGSGRAAQGAKQPPRNADVVAAHVDPSHSSSQLAPQLSRRKGRKKRSQQDGEADGPVPLSTSSRKSINKATAEAADDEAGAPLASKRPHTHTLSADGQSQRAGSEGHGTAEPGPQSRRSARILAKDAGDAEEESDWEGRPKKRRKERAARAAVAAVAQADTGGGSLEELANMAAGLESFVFEQSPPKRRKRSKTKPVRVIEEIESAVEEAGYGRSP